MMMISVDDVCDILWKHHLHLKDGLTPWVIVDEVIEALVTSDKIVEVCEDCPNYGAKKEERNVNED